MENLTPEQIKALEDNVGEPCRFVQYPGIGTVVFKQASEEAWGTFSRAQRQFALGKIDSLSGAMKNLVADCLVHPSSVEFDAAVRKGKRWRAWQDIADKIFEWAGADSDDVRAQALGNG